MDKIIVEVHKPLEKSEKKFEAVVAELAKAMKVTPAHVHGEEKTEPTPYPALQELSDSLRAGVSMGLIKLFQAIIRTWFRTEPQTQDQGFEKFRKAMGDGSEPFTLHGTTYLNPSTGAPLTRAEWEKIASDLDAAFGYLYGETDQSLIYRAMALGKILQGMPVPDQVSTGLGSILPTVDDTAKALGEDDYYRNMMDFAEIHTGELIQDLTTSSRKAVVATILDAQKNKLSARETEDKLFEVFAGLNRDWRRIAETETATNFNNGYLLAENSSKKSVDEPVFMRGVSGAGACGFCSANVNGRVVVLLEDAPAGADDTVTVQGRTYTAIWPGKTNFGRRAANWWVAAGTQHPHCRCTWTRYNPDMGKYYDMLDAAMAKQALEASK